MTAHDSAERAAAALLHAELVLVLQGLPEAELQAVVEHFVEGLAQAAD